MGVEHVFGFMHHSTRGVLIRTIGKARAKIKIRFINMTYNLFKYTWYKKSSMRGLPRSVERQNKYHQGDEKKENCS